MPATSTTCSSIEASPMEWRQKSSPPSPSTPRAPRSPRYHFRQTNSPPRDNWRKPDEPKEKKRSGEEETSALFVRRDEMLKEGAKKYGDTRPHEKDLGKMYRRYKSSTSRFMTWLVETLFPSGDLPGYVKFAKVKPESENHPKYEVSVNEFTTLANLLIEQNAMITPEMLNHLNTIIDIRSPYSYWMARKSASKVEYEDDEKHIHFLEAMAKVKTILTERQILREPHLKHSSEEAIKSAPMSFRRHNLELGKRKASITPLTGSEETKATKMESSTSQASQRPMRTSWRDCAAVDKPASYALVVSKVVVKGG